MEKKPVNLYSFRYTIKPDQIPGFVSELHRVQADMIEAVVESKATQGYPEANALLKQFTLGK